LVYSTGNHLSNNLHPIRSVQKTQQIHQQYSYSKFNNEQPSSGEVDWSQVPKVSIDRKNSKSPQKEAVLIDLSDESPKENQTLNQQPIYGNCGVNSSSEKTPVIENGLSSSSSGSKRDRKFITKNVRSSILILSCVMWTNTYSFYL